MTPLTYPQIVMKQLLQWPNLPMNQGQMKLQADELVEFLVNYELPENRSKGYNMQIWNYPQDHHHVVGYKEREIPPGGTPSIPNPNENQMLPIFNSVILHETLGFYAGE
mmetsp:Transcript_286/g.510  ORF Transcript_286/g.510 Transcript_286/m.510 type:complete len:109 (+) Transcript_286:239-565(+)